jgi:hypothetical protein
MQFQARSQVLSGPELLELVAISPDELAIKAVRRVGAGALALRLRDPLRDRCSYERRAAARSAAVLAPPARGAVPAPPLLPARARRHTARPGTPSQGFRAQDPEVDDIVRAAHDLAGCCVAPDASLSAEENVELLLRALRLAQLGLEVQVSDNDGLLSEANGLRDEVKASLA